MTRCVDSATIPSMKAQRMNHVGIIVDDLEAAKAFFFDLGFELDGEGDIEGEWVERIIGLHGVKNSFAMLRTPDGGANIELIKFYAPNDENGMQRSFANTLGIRHIAFEVDDIDAIVANLNTKGTQLVGEVVNYEGIYKLCYVRGPEGIILELAEKLK